MTKAEAIDVLVAYACCGTVDKQTKCDICPYGEFDCCVGYTVRENVEEAVKTLREADGE